MLSFRFPEKRSSSSSWLQLCCLMQVNWCIIAYHPPSQIKHSQLRPAEELKPLPDSRHRHSLKLHLVAAVRLEIRLLSVCGVFHPAEPQSLSPWLGWPSEVRSLFCGAWFPPKMEAALSKMIAFNPSFLCNAWTLAVLVHRWRIFP